MRLTGIQSALIRYIIENGYSAGDTLPTIQDISKDLDVSVAKMREALEVARIIGIVDVKPGRGTRVLEYDFMPAVKVSTLYAIAQDSSHFDKLLQMRNTLEIGFWAEAVTQLQADDFARLYELVDKANALLSKQNIQVPAKEHRDFHLIFFSRLDNPFVQGVLEAYWEAYDAFGFNLYMALEYHRNVWEYHARIVEAVEAGNIESSRQLMIEHMNLLSHRSQDNHAQSNGNSPDLFE